MTKPNRMATPRSVRVIEVVEVIALRGTGQDGDPIREITQYWSADEDGRLLAEYDACREPEVLP